MNACAKIYTTHTRVPTGQKPKWKGNGGKKKGAGKWTKGGKLVIEFDPEARREFLTGFRKRKTERRNIAQANILRKEAEQRKQEKKERREEMKRLVAKFELDKELG